MPTNYTSFDYANACSNPSDWGVPYNAGNDNYQWARSGNAYIGIFVINFPPFHNTREYYQTKLKDSLRVGKNYLAEFYVVFNNNLKLKCNNISMLLTKTSVYVDTAATPYGVLYANPQITNYGNPIINDTLNWVKVSGIYKALGGEQYLTLGNFKDDANTSYFASQPTGYNGAGIMIDDVSVIPLDSMCLKADAGKDTAITLGDSVFIGSYTNGLDSVKWQIQNTTIDSTRPGFWVHPTVTTSYVLQQVVNGCFSADTVVVTVGTVPLTMVNYQLLIVNEKQVLNKWVTANEINVSHFNIQRSVNGKDFITIGKVAANNKSYNEYKFIEGVSAPSPLGEGWGEAFYRIESVDRDGRKQYSGVKQLAIRNEQLAINVYPNPAKEQITIECKGAKELSIIDYLGRAIFLSTVDGRPLTVNTKQFAKGLYIVKVVTANGATVISKFVKE